MSSELFGTFSLKVCIGWLIGLVVNTILFLFHQDLGAFVSVLFATYGLGLVLLFVAGTLMEDRGAHAALLLFILIPILILLTSAMVVHVNNIVVS